MSLDQFLHFIIAHNATIIEVLIGLTLVGALFLSVRTFLAAKDPEASGGSLQNSQIEATMKQLIDRAGHMPTSASTEESSKLLGEISQLKLQLEERQKELEQARLSPLAATSQAPSGISDEEKRKMEAQIQELNAKLSEYEIISEDIADLSFYKEQNTKLQKELESLKSGGPVAAAVAATPAAATPAAAPAPAVEAPVAAAPEPTKAEPEIVGKSRSEETLVEPAPAEAAATAPPAAAAVEETSHVVDDDLMAEFAAAVEKQRSASDEAPAAPAAESADVDLGKMDMDKMMAEAAVIKTDVPEVDPEKALGNGLDESKLLQEAAALEGVTSEDQKLMGEFENFVKKSES